MTQLMKMLAVLTLLGLFPLSGKALAQECAANWSPKDYKSFVSVQDEVKKQFGDVRILRVVLCDAGGNAYFQVVIITGQGEVRRVQVAAVQ